MHNGRRRGMELSGQSQGAGVRGGRWGQLENVTNKNYLNPSK